MSTESLNFQQLMETAKQGGSFTPMPEGTYTVKVATSEPTESSNGNPMIKVKYEVIGGEYNGRFLWDNHVIAAQSPFALSKFFEAMDCFGLSADFFSQNPSLDLIAATLAGKLADVEVELGEWKGKARNEVAGYHPAPAGGGAVPSSQIMGSSPTERSKAF